MFLRRGEIVVANLGRDARGREIGNKQEDGGPVRPVVVVSSTLFNQNRLRVTVVPITNYKKAGKELKVNWGFWISRESVRDCSLKYDESLVDCGQLMTIFAVPNGHAQSGKIHNDVRFHQRCGKLRDRLRLDLGLQIICNEQLIIPAPFWKQRFSATPVQGDIVRAELPLDIQGNTSRVRHGLVVSASAVDGIRDWIGHITVVPLREPAVNQTSDRGGLVHIAADGLTSEKWLANCEEPCTIDWRQREVRTVGRIHDADNMARVLRALRQYLDLPAQGASYGA